MPLPETLTRRNGRAAPPRGVALLGLGSALPERVVTNAEISASLGVDEQWIVKRTGIRERRWAPAEAHLHELAAPAAAAALADAGLEASDLDLVLVGDLHRRPDHPEHRAARRRGARRGALRRDRPRRRLHRLRVRAQPRSRDDRGRPRAARAGDRRRDPLAPPRSRRPQGRRDLRRRRGRRRPRRRLRMRASGPSSWAPTGRSARSCTPTARTAGSAWTVPRSSATPSTAWPPRRSRRARARAPRSTTSTCCVFHQANARILQALIERLALDPDRVVAAIGEHGNTSAASIPLALDAARRDGLLRDGASVLLAAFGAGLTWGAAVVHWRSADAS